MKTYAEIKGEPPFDWNAFLAQDEFDLENLEQAATLAECWVTCACGNQCEAIPRYPDGTPIDRQLHQFGCDFYEAIEKMAAAQSWDELNKVIEHRDEARQILEIIEDLSIQLLKPLVP